MVFAFEMLLVYQKAIDFSDTFCSRTERFTRGYGFLVDQLSRASLSIAANIAPKEMVGLRPGTAETSLESHGARSKSAFRFSSWRSDEGWSRPRSTLS